MLKRRQVEQGLTIILITHDMSVAAVMSDRIGVMYAGKLVELGRTANIIRTPKHPYTAALLNAVPKLQSSGERIEGIPGYPPALLSPPPGCRFRSRCKYAMAKCLEEPLLETVDDGQVACWLREERDGPGLDN
jgi:peptide/nickel transport system ATP-binding protein